MLGLLPHEQTTPADERPAPARGATVVDEAVRYGKTLTNTDVSQTYNAKA